MALAVRIPRTADSIHGGAEEANLAINNREPETMHSRQSPPRASKPNRCAV